MFIYYRLQIGKSRTANEIWSIIHCLIYPHFLLFFLMFLIMSFCHLFCFDNLVYFDNFCSICMPPVHWAVSVAVFSTVQSIYPRYIFELAWEIWAHCKILKVVLPNRDVSRFVLLFRCEFNTLSVDIILCTIFFHQLNEQKVSCTIIRTSSDVFLFMNIVLNPIAIGLSYAIISNWIRDGLPLELLYWPKIAIASFG